jgi:hypothetical protein
MAIYKNLERKDIATTRQLLHEAIPITGTIVSGTYSDENIFNYSHGMFQSVYDYPYLSSSANHLLDLTVGYANSSALSSSTNVDNAKKINLYNQMAQLLVGYDITGSILDFDQDGDIAAGGTKLKECVFVNFSRLLQKDEIKKGSVSFQITTGGALSGALSGTVTVTDSGAETNYRVNSPVGEYAVLSASNGYYSGTLGPSVGLIYYQAGIAVLTASLFDVTGSESADFNIQDLGTNISSSTITVASPSVINAIMTGTSIQHACNSFRSRWADLDFNNTVELNSTIYFVRANHNEFNYSSNPTYLSSSKMRVKSTTQDEPVTYITTVGLHAADGALLATAKLSEPIKKTSSNEIILRVRTDF